MKMQHFLYSSDGVVTHRVLAAFLDSLLAPESYVTAQFQWYKIQESELMSIHYANIKN